jgi:hypothetical protein
MKQQLAKSIKTKSLVNYNLDSKDSLKITTIRQAVLSNSPSLTKIIKESSITKAEGIIEALLFQLNERIKIKEKLSENDMRRLADSIIGKYSGLKISDIIYVFNKIADGEIDLYGSLSHRDIMGALYKHKEERWKHK